jgi:hypothetical protein
MEKSSPNFRRWSDAAKPWCFPIESKCLIEHLYQTKSLCDLDKGKEQKEDTNW